MRRYDLGRIVARLGTVADSALAREICAPPLVVGSLRRRLGIASFASRRWAPMLPYLGRVPDSRLARHFRCCRMTVARLREARGIPPCDARQARIDRELREYARRLAEEVRS